MSKKKLSLNNISVLKFSKLNDIGDYNVLNYIKGKAEFMQKPCNIMQMPYTNVKHCMMLLRKSNGIESMCEVFQNVFDIDADTFYNGEILSYFEARNHIFEMFKLIAENETKLSQGGNTDLGKWKMAGGDRLSNYDAMLPLDTLAQRYGGYPFDLGRKPYSEVFYLMAMSKTINEVNYNYQTMK